MTTLVADVGNRIMEILRMEPASWTHADDIFLLGFYGGRNKAEIASAWAGLHAQDNLFQRAHATLGTEGLDLDSTHPGLVASRVTLGAFIDWNSILNPLIGESIEIGAGFKGGSLSVRQLKQFAKNGAP